MASQLSYRSHRSRATVVPEGRFRARPRTGPETICTPLVSSLAPTSDPNKMNMAPSAMVTALLLLLVGWPARAEPGNGGPQPLVSIPKSTYAAGEAVFFWVGVQSETPLTRETYEPCRIEVIGSHGSPRVTCLEMPVDGDTSHGWRGGDGLQPEESLPGTYSVRVTCHGKTAAAGFQIEPTSIVRELEARFDCHRGCGGDPTDTTISLMVVNHSDQGIVVSRPGAMMGYGVGFQAEWQHPPGSCWASLPAEALGLKTQSAGDVVVDTMTRESLPHVAHFELRPGESRVQSFC